VKTSGPLLIADDSQKKKRETWLKEGKRKDRKNNSRLSRRGQKTSRGHANGTTPPALEKKPSAREKAASTRAEHLEVRPHILKQSRKQNRQAGQQQSREKDSTLNHERKEAPKLKRAGRTNHSRQKAKGKTHRKGIIITTRNKEIG